MVTIAAKHTVQLTIGAFAIGFALALLLALMRLSPLRPYRWFAIGWIELFRGLPALVTILVVGFAMPIALDFRIPGALGPGAVALGIVYSAYIAETIRAGIESVPRGQAEAARSLGMTAPRTMGTIVLPQALRIVVPPLTNEVIALIKDTSLIFVLGQTIHNIEITGFARNNLNDTFNITPMVAAALVYLAITVPLTRAVAVLERRNRRAR